MPVSSSLVSRPVLWGFYKKGVVLAQVVDIENGMPLMENCMSYHRFSVTQVQFGRDWVRVTPAVDE
jgi:hypothetical protein